MTVVSLDEHRANREADADLDYTPLTTEQSLPHARRILALLEREHHVEPDHGQGTCTSCGNEAPVRFTYGPTLQLCRPCRRARLRAAAQADMPLPAGPPLPDLEAELFTKAQRWIPSVATTMPLAQIEIALRNAGITQAHIHELVDQAANLAHQT